MRLPPDASRLVVRQTFLDRTAEQPAEVHIERLGLGGGGDLGGSRGGSSSGAPAGEVRPPLSAAQVGDLSVRKREASGFFMLAPSIRFVGTRVVKRRGPAHAVSA